MAEKELEAELKQKYDRLVELLASYGSVVIGYSGGVDSVLLTYVCHQVMGPDRYLACLAVSPSLARREHENALKNARDFGFHVEPFESTEFDDPDFLKNDARRCFYCKSDLFRHLEQFREKKGFARILYGGNLDDLGDYRPAHDAAEKFNAVAPMALAKLTKQDIRNLSRHFRLPTFNKAAMPCLSSRLPYGSEITLDKLTMVEKGEDLLTAMGFTNFRVRHEGDTARLEVPVDEFPKLMNPKVTQELAHSIKELGFKRVVLDLEGLRSGNLNEDLKN
jgi:uncharacterized protein